MCAKVRATKKEGAEETEWVKIKEKSQMSLFKVAGGYIDCDCSLCLRCQGVVSCGQVRLDIVSSELHHH